MAKIKGIPGKFANNFFLDTEYEDKMKNSKEIKKDTILKISTAYITLFLTMVSFLVFFNSQQKNHLVFSLALLFLVILLFTIVNLQISMGSVKRTESLYNEKESFFEKICNISSQGILLIDESGIIKDLNIKAQSYFYEEKENILGNSIFRNIDCELKSNKKFRTVFYNDMGSHFQAEAQIKGIIHENQKHYILFIEDQTERINKEKLLKKLASEDPLTGLLNRRSFLHELRKELERSSRIGLTCTIAMIDLDHFKDINDTYGHDFGDEVLKVFSSILKENSRQLDIICRFGGEEFLILFPHTDLNSSLHFLERVKEQFADHLYSNNIRPTFSAGAINTELKGDKIDVDLLLKEADLLLYKAKENGRNRIEIKGHKIKLVKVS